MDTDNLTLRQLQQESARALVVLQATNHNLSQFNRFADHNSHNWYKAVIDWYVDIYGGLPSTTGPGCKVSLIDV